MDAKRQLIDDICAKDMTKSPESLAGFSEQELEAYLEHLTELELEELKIE